MLNVCTATSNVNSKYQQWSIREVSHVIVMHSVLMQLGNITDIVHCLLLSVQRLVLLVDCSGYTFPLLKKENLTT